MCSRMADEPRLEAGAHPFEEGRDKAPNFVPLRWTMSGSPKVGVNVTVTGSSGASSSANRVADSDQLVSVLR